MHPVTKSLVQLNTAVLLLGGTTLFAKLISLPAHAITFYRSVAGVLALAVFIKFTKTGFRLSGRSETILMIAAGALLGLHWVALFHAIQISSVAIGILSLYTFPVITAILEPLAEKKRPRTRNLIPALIVFAGIVLITPDIRPSNPIAIGVMWGLISAGLFSVRNILVRKKLSHISGSLAMCYQMLVTCVLLVPLATPAAGLLQDNRLILLVVLGIFFTALPHVLIVASLRNLTATTFSLIACLHPLYSILLAMAVLSEFPSARVLGGGAIIISMAVYESVRVSLKNNPDLDKS